MNVRFLASLGLTALVLSARPVASHAQTATNPPTDSIQLDARLIRHAVADNLMEARLGEFARDHAANSQVRGFGERMAIDHKRLADQWTGMAEKHGLAVKPGLSASQQQKVAELEKSSGVSFDKQYMIAMIQNHSKDAAELKTAMDSARSGPVRKMAGYARPIVLDHLLSAQAAGKEVGVDSATVARSEHVAESK
jgi:putative membrane protein